MEIFYDIHFHAMNLSHPNFFALYQRLDSLKIFSFLKSETIRNTALESLVTPLQKVPVFSNLLARDSHVINLLAMMENDIGSFFLILEYCLKYKKPTFDKGIFIRHKHQEHHYEKIVLIPLIMDFGNKDIPVINQFYNIPPRKPVVEQTIDLFNGISKYCQHELCKGKDNPDHAVYHNRKGEKLFEIYPFMGINTRNYTLTEIEELLEKYFSKYVGKRDYLLAKLGEFDGNIDHLSSNFFAGIKLYPPLGFDPWPLDAPCELEKVRLLYKYCSARQIPITAHCGKLGYDVDEDTEQFTSPNKWEDVLQEFNNLKLNLAHFGQEKKWFSWCPEWTTEWEKKIIKLVTRYPNVYTDFSFRGVYDNYYRHLSSLLDKHEILNYKVLFGSDFMINLLEINSYNEYLAKFAETDNLTLAQKHQFCHDNPEKFLFSKAAEPSATNLPSP